MSYPEKNASYQNKPKWLDAMKRAEGGGADDDPVFNIESRDYSKQPASVSEMVGNTAKMIAEPYARVIRNGIRDFGPTGNESIDSSGKVHGMAQGGKVKMTAGAESGAGRLEKAEARAEDAEHEEPQT